MEQMRLYKAELYKLFHKKAVLISLLASFLIIFLYFYFVCAGEETATVNGKTYAALEAIQINREITEEFKGILTDKKVEEIIQKYGFPKQVEENYPGFRDANFLNSFVAECLSDGYIHDWDNYKIPTKIILIQNSALGEIQENRKEPLQFAYINGWNTFADTMQMGMVLVSIIVVIAVSGMFSEESQCKMLPLLFTTEKGKKQCIAAKILAAFTATIILYIAILLVSFIAAISLYGTDGLGCVAGMMNPAFINKPVSQLSISKYLFIILALGFLGILFLCAVTLLISAKCRSSFHALVLASICWGGPVMLRIFFGGFAYLLISATPIFLIMRYLIYDIYSMSYVPVSIAAAGSIICVVKGYKAFKNVEV